MNEEKRTVYAVRQDGATYDIRAAQGSKKKKSITGIVIFGIVVAVIVLIALLISGGSDSGESSGNSYPADDFIAKINVEGTIAANTQSTGLFSGDEGYDHDWTIKTIDELIDEESNKGLLLYINTPGGSVYETDELYLKIKEYQKKTKRPVYAVMGHIAASGGYYIAAPCDKILANRNTWTGSIGVTLGNMMDFSGLLNQYGVKVNTITSGPNKAMGNNMQPMTDEQRAIFQSLVDEAYEQFAGIVAEGRGMDMSEVKKIADGRIYTAKQAKEVNLIDGICSYEEAEQIMKDDKRIGGAEVIDLNENDRNFLAHLFGKIDISKLRLSIFPNSGSSLVDEVLGNKSQVEVKYYCEELAY